MPRVKPRRFRLTIELLSGSIETVIRSAKDAEDAKLQALIGRNRLRVLAVEPISEDDYQQILRARKPRMFWRFRPNRK